MKAYAKFAAVLCLMYISFFVGGVLPREQKNAASVARVELVMYNPNGTVSRTYYGINEWNYSVVNGVPTMRLGFVNPTLYRCGFEP